MSSGKRSGFGDWDKGETGSQDVGLGLRLQHPHQNHVYSSSGEGMAAKVVFTANQREELERQTMIYKYMMASIPIPPELIIPLSKYPNLPPLLNHNDHSSVRKGLQLRYTGGGGRGGGVGINGDPEPWRCRRTDGKKWRCSRDVAPDQKYCERHSHKGRPSARSRKPVESSLVSTTSTATSSNPIALNPFQHHPYNYDSPSSLTQYNHHTSLRYPDWFMKEEHLVPSAQVLYSQQMQQFSGENRGHSHASQFKPRTSPSDQTTRPLPRPFIDAWSLEDIHKVANTNLTLPTEVTSSSKCTNHNSSPLNANLPLTLSMSAGFDPNNDHNSAKDEDSMTLRGIRSSWVNLPSGGPLAEALCLGMSGTTNAWGTHTDELVSPNGHSTSSTSTTMSSKGSHASGDTGCQGFHLR
ncbi:growth-regulating factor 8-like isoform X1 [Silene latifolia]|uniref:growth-regulating factor 8-like isoform X1 n=1 Tax=Silene latifolia TaxID=37657 RepID=UPI003D76A53F